MANGKQHFGLLSLANNKKDGFWFYFTQKVLGAETIEAGTEQYRKSFSSFNSTRIAGYVKVVQTTLEAVVGFSLLLLSEI